MKRLLIAGVLLLLLPIYKLSAQEADPNNGLKHWMTPEESLRANEIGLTFVETDPPSGIIRNVEEFGPTESVLIRYPFGIPMSLIKEMAKDCKVVTIVANSSQQTTVNSQYVSNGVNTDNCSYLIAQTDSYWTRDYGPWYVTYGDNQTGIVDFPYNRPRPNDDEIPKKVAQMQGIEWFGMNVIHTGGNYMTNGLGQASSTTLVWEENPTQTHEQIAQKMHDYLGIDTYMVEEDPNGTYIDHIDCWGKFLAPDKILIRKVPATHPQYNLIEQTAAFYAGQISPYGTPYRVFRVNTPNNEPYTNSFIFNNKVFIPFMGTTNDAGALLAYQQAMPGYQISGYLALPSAAWESTDAMHCRTHEMADRGMLYIAHMPLLGSVPAQAGFTLNADITAFSQEAIYSDSVWAIYKVNNGDWDTLSMINTGANHFEAVIPGQMEGSTVSYYIHAKDASGRSASHPFIGAPDPHKFQIAVSSPSDVVVAPDTLFFTTFEDLYYGKTVTVRNYTARNITLPIIQNIGNDPFPWFVDPWNISLPVQLASGDSLSLQVKVQIPAERTNWQCDTMLIATDSSIHTVMICADPSVLTGIASHKESVSVYPNPASTVATFEFGDQINKDAFLSVTTSTGKTVKVLNRENEKGNHATFTWRLDDQHGNPVPAGLYLYQYRCGEKFITGKLSVIH